MVSYSSLVKNLDKLYILAMGESTGMSDTIIVCSYDPKTQEASMLSIPRDTFIGESKKRATTSDKINALYNGGKKPEKNIECKLSNFNQHRLAVIRRKIENSLSDIIQLKMLNVCTMKHYVRQNM